MCERLKNPPLIDKDRDPIPYHTVTLRARENEIELMRDNAEKYAGGNLSAWLRYIGIHGKPLGKHLNRATTQQQLEQIDIEDLGRIAESNLGDMD